MALSSFEDDPAARRVRVAATATGHPKLRVALDRALDGELEEEEFEAAVAPERES